MTSLFICNYSPSRLYLVGGPARLFSFKGRESSWLTGIFATPALHADTSLRVILFLSYIRYGVSRTATEKQNEEKKTEGRHCSFRGETRINLSRVRDGAADYGNSEKWERARTDVRRNDGPLQKLLLGLTPALVVSIVCSRRCLRWWLSSHEWASPSLVRLLASPSLPRPFPCLASNLFFFYRLLFGAHFSPTPHVSSDNVWRKSVMRMWMLR